MKQILDILNPVHEPTVSEWEKIAQIAFDKLHDERELFLPAKTLNLMQRWEELTRGKWVVNEVATGLGYGYNKDKQITDFHHALLTKEMFVNSVEKPLSLNSVKYKWGKNIGLPREDLKKGHIREYQAAQSEVLFEGFEKLNEESVHVSGHLFICGSGYIFSGTNKIYNPTLSDFLTEISRYNRTATKPIEIKFTENIVKKLLA